MVSYECDICRRKVKEDELETLILFKRSIDYCKNCKDKAMKIKKTLIKSRNYYEKEMYKNLEIAEKNILSKGKINK